MEVIITLCGIIFAGFAYILVLSIIKSARKDAESLAMMKTWQKMKEYCWCHHKFEDDIKCWYRLSYGGTDKSEPCDYDWCPILNKQEE